MPVVPCSLDGLLFLFREGFSAPTFQTFRMLVVGFVCRVGEHTVCGMLQGARLERVWHHSRAHAFFAEREWCPDELGLLLLDFLVATFVAAGAPIRLASMTASFTAPASRFTAPRGSTTARWRRARGASRAMATTGCRCA